MSDRPLKALVTGAAHPGGIGAAIAQRLAADGLEVVTLDRAPGCTYQVDLVTDELPPLDDIDVLVSNAGLPTIVGGAHSMDLERWQRDLSVNLTGSFRVVQACLRGMRERRFGRIVVISSFAARFGMPAQVAYSASKAGLIGHGQDGRRRERGLGITANAILPGLVASAGVQGDAAGDHRRLAGADPHGPDGADRRDRRGRLLLRLARWRAASPARSSSSMAA